MQTVFKQLRAVVRRQNKLAQEVVEQDTAYAKEREQVMKVAEKAKVAEERR